jgi:hypothetical protein
MSFNNSLPQDLSRYAIGEIVDLAGVPSFYDAGSSKWLKSATFVSGSLLTTAVKNTLSAASGTNIAVASATDTYLEGLYPFVGHEVARIPASNISVIPCTGESGTYGFSAIALTSAGAQSIGIVAPSVPYLATYVPGTIISNGTTLFCYYLTSTTALACKTSTDGITWTTQTLTGLPSIAVSNSSAEFWPSSVSDNNSVGTLRKVVNPANGFMAVLWCGARFIMVNSTGAGVYTTSTSTDGLTWSGDTTTTVLGAATTISGSNMNFYRNGNNCYLCLSNTVVRKSSDGGITWANSVVTNTINNATTQNILKNITDPTKLIMPFATSSTVAYYSSDSGATWSASRPLPTTPDTGLVYKGSIVLLSTQTSIWRSADDGNTWTRLVLPIGALASGGSVRADSNRFYLLLYSQAQILTSTDGLTWTIRTTPFAVSTTNYGLIEFSSNIVYIINTSFNGGIFTIDGGVTWVNCTTYTNSLGSSGWNSYFLAIPDGNAGGYGFGLMQQVNSNADKICLSGNSLSGGGANYRAGSTAITSLRTNASAYIRVG